MWHPLTRLLGGDVTVPVPTPSGIDWGGIVDRIADFVIANPVPVLLAAATIAIVGGWRRGGVFKGLVIGMILAFVLLFVVRAVT